MGGDGTALAPQKLAADAERADRASQSAAAHWQARPGACDAPDDTLVGDVFSFMA
jgi:hypothetical protein